MFVFHSVNFSETIKKKSYRMLWGEQESGQQILYGAQWSQGKMSFPAAGPLVSVQSSAHTGTQWTSAWSFWRQQK